MRISTLIIAGILGASCWVTASSQTGVQEEVTLLTIELNDGTIDRFNLPDKPVMTFTDDGRLTVSSGVMSGDYLRSEVSHFRFETGAPVVSQATAEVDHDSFFFSFVDNATLVIDSNSLSRVSVYDIAGHLVASVEARNGHATVDLSTLPAGVYIVDPANHEPLKIIKK